ncbi:MAG: YciK family oxidoreductase [Gammaproteobacteria bacterium]|nr:YciK family oxidoreductase [Gammaproteobacteria bacterium]
MPSYVAPADALAGRVILVTGAGGGIGRAAATTFAGHGATVILLGKTLSKLERVYDDIEKGGGPQPAMLTLDFLRAAPEEYDGLAQTIAQEFGRLDGLLHNAAILGALAPVEHFEWQTWNQVLQVNLHAAFLLTRACLPLLKQSSDASIVFTTADVGRKSRAYWGAYATACFALEGLAQTLADEVAQNTTLRVNTLDPGAVRTDFRAQAYPAENPLAHPPAADIMSTYLYLLGPASRGVSGRAFTAEK